MKTRSWTAALLAALSLALVDVARGASDARPARVAVVVGANDAAPGRVRLRFGHHDADRMADVLRAVAGFAADDVIVLKDPTPAELLAAVQRGIARLAGRSESLLYFYYSGHADERSLFPHGRALPLQAVRALIDEAPVAIRIGVVDACQGGSWTRAKGLTADEPFEIRWPVNLGTEGSVLIASSSGLESAHESDHLQGSFFTVHFVNGLRGAADRNGDGQVTLNETFEYARERTIRDTFRLTPEVQSPSFGMNLRGRRDLVLAQIDASPSRLELAQEEGPLHIIHASSGVQVLELMPGRRLVKLALPPGRYLVRKADARGNRVKEVAIEAGTTRVMVEDELVVLGAPQLARKSAAPGAVANAAAPPPATRRLVLLPAIGSGFGWSRGQPVVNPTYVDDDARKADHDVRGFAAAKLLHLAPELGYLVSRRLLLSAQVRLQLVRGTSELYHPSCEPGPCRGPQSSLAVLVRASSVHETSPRGRVWLSLAAGAGTIRHVVAIPQNDCGTTRDQTCMDALDGGPALFGLGAGYLYQILPRTSIYAGALLLTGLPRTMVNLDGTLGLAFEL